MFKRLLALILLTSSIFSGEPKKQTRVYVDVVGDLFHSGHVEFFKKAKAMGDYLIVGVLSDETVESYKRRPVYHLDERAAVIAACRYVDEIVIDCPLGVTEELLDAYKIDLVVHGDDFDEKMAREQYGPALDRGIFKTVPYTKGISTSDLIERFIAQYETAPSSLRKKDYYEGTQAALEKQDK